MEKFLYVSLEPAEISSFWRNLFCWVSSAKCKYKPQDGDGFLDFESQGPGPGLLAGIRNNGLLFITMGILASWRTLAFLLFFLLSSFLHVHPPLLDPAFLTAKEADADLPSSPVHVTWADVNTEHGSTHRHPGDAGAGGAGSPSG